MDEAEHGGAGRDAVKRESAVFPRQTQRAENMKVVRDDADALHVCLQRAQHGETVAHVLLRARGAILQKDAVCVDAARDEMIADAFRLAHRLVLALPAGGDAYRIRVFLQIDARGVDALPQRPARAVFIDSRAENAHAAGATLTGTAAPQAGDTVTLTLSVPNKVYGLTADLSYSGNLSFTNYNCSVSGWSIVVNNNKFSVYGTSSSSGGLVTIKMKVSGSAKEGDALTATFSNIVVSDGNSDTSLDSASWSGKVGAAPSGNCSLSSLSCSNATLSPSFSSSTTYYTCTVPFAVEKLDLNYKKDDNSATVSVSGNELAVGVNTVTIKVTAANGATKSYTIDATRQQDPNYKPSTDASIAALTLEGATLSPAFTPTVTDYIAYVPYETKQVTIAATAKDEKAQGITGTGEVRLSATEAETVLTVTGTAEDGKTKQNYTIHVLRMPAYTGIVPTVEVIDPATIPEVPPLEIPGTIAMPLIGEVKTVYVAIAAAVLLVVVLFLLGFLIGRGHTGGGDDEEYDDEPPRTPAKPLLPEERHTARVPRLVPREESSDSEPVTIPDKTPADPVTPAAPAEEPATAERSAQDEPTQADEDEVRTMSLDDLLDDIHNM